MLSESIESANKQIRFVTYLGIVWNLVLFVLKILVGLWGHSVALIADGVHSLSDMSTDLMVLLGVHFGSKRPDKSHPYGHGRIETFSTLFIGVVLSGVGIGMIWRAGMGIAAGDYAKPNFLVLIVAMVSVVVKEGLYRITRKTAVTTHSTALYANAWHHRSDALSSVVVVLGFISQRFGFNYGDLMAAAGVGVMIVLVGLHVLGDCVRELTEGAVDEGTVEHIKEIINTNREIRQWHRLRTRTVGREVFLDLHILVAPELDVRAAHEIAEELETKMHEGISRPVNITIHVEPDLPELRK